MAHSNQSACSSNQMLVISFSRLNQFLLVNRNFCKNVCDSSDFSLQGYANALTRLMTALNLFVPAYTMAAKCFISNKQIVFCLFTFCFPKTELHYKR